MMSDQLQAEQLLESCARPDARDRLGRRSVSRDETGTLIQRQRFKRRYPQQAPTVWSSEFRNVIARKARLIDREYIAGIVLAAKVAREAHEKESFASNVAAPLE